MVTYTGQVTYSTAADEDYRVFLEIVTNTGNVARNLKTVGQTNSREFTQSRVRLLRRGRRNFGADASLLGRTDVSGDVFEGVEALLQYRCFGLVHLIAAALLNQLVKSRHVFPPFL